MTSPRILIVDDEADLRELLEITLVRMGLDVDSAHCLEDARARLAKADYALVLTDMRLPDGMGIELVREVAANCRNTPIAVITAYGSADNAVAALKAGAFDYLSKPVALEQLRQMVQSALHMNVTGISADHRNAQAAGTSSCLVGQSGVMQDLRLQIARLARSMAPVAITGESGSGKELAARDIHAHSARVDKPFLAVNCGAIPEALMEAEFFGYRKGAFTGATDDRDGFFQAANGGTLMLDEVADLPLQMQVKLLRAIQERRVRKIGSTVEEPVDVRLISATHQNLAECVEQGRFRQDLYYRLNVIELRLPPLRERLDDIGLLADAILERLAAPGVRAVLSPSALDALQAYAFPGNVRELENILERALAFANDGLIEVADLALKAVNSPAIDVRQASDAVALAMPDAAALHVPTPAARSETTDAEALPSSLPDHLDGIERQIIERALLKTRFNRTQAAGLLGISFRQLRYRMQRLSIHEPE
ncbi:sigma-54-dependent Fis family transcriptional regulator [Noviherbaspirillum cavernae]|uniref:Sigma-54-dependent Fis family transcriptional regulator n=1 Tax=Noviherbaspirillum cavernae TaxID=2320862 RepID=A0A418WXX1_9BURK|nr:sigma-54 dependent transcriptional regulator [Noviherbaspirillum cavernae]RJG05088.1 sigma-54-dependent Fis family transcriptional regulator [Noviherbaspirillum cavernae]